MDPYLKPADRPVVMEFESLETVFAKDQPEYIPLRALRSPAPNGDVLSRWTFTDEQRQAISDGADIFLNVMTFGQPLQPVRIFLAHELDASSVADALSIPIPEASLPQT